MNAIIFGMPDEDYRQAEGFNASGLKHMRRSAAHYRTSLDEKQEATPALAQGIVFHHLLLTPEAPMRVAIKPDGFDGRTAAGKAWIAKHEGLPTITHEQFTACQRMVEQIRKHPNAAAAFGQGKPEVSVFAEWQNPYNGETVQLKSRMDFINDGAAIVDAKTTDDARPASFAAVAVEYGYFWQAVFYRDFVWNPACVAIGKPEWKKSSFVFVAVEKTPPYAVKCYCVGPGTFDVYRPRIEEEIIKYQLGKSSGIWPAYPEAVALLSPPEWAVHKEVNNAMKLEATI